ncbi:MAG: ATP-binding protein [Candidatus Delongbacteria bacterium]|nr:ATP-binding protein [Candidatus Delongbacteria bacterium]
MLVRFVVSNFLSFDEEVEFNMLAGSFKNHKHHVYKKSKLNILKASAIYGSNGAGKSNLIEAIEYLQEMVQEGRINYPNGELKFKLNPDNKLNPSYFEVEIALNHKLYVYGLTLDNNNIIEEWLYESKVNTEAKMIFERKLNKKNKIEINVAQKYKNSKKAKLLIELMEENLLKNNELFIGKTDSLKIDELDIVRRWFGMKLVIIHPNSKTVNLVSRFAKSDKFKLFANELLQTFNTGVSELVIKKLDFDKFFGEDEAEMKKEIILELDKGEEIEVGTTSGGAFVKKEGDEYIVRSIVALHKDSKGEDISFPINIESDGTQRLLDFIPAFDGILQHEMTFIIDEIDQSLHPTLLYALVNKIMKDETTKGQFIFSTHESNLLNLDIFRQDEIWFVEKDKTSNSSKMYSLSEFKPRNDLDIRKGYLRGRFGAIPFMADLENLNW